MASWGNQAGDQYTQDMDSDGHKLSVNGNSGGGTNFQAVFADSNAAGNAVKVDGRIVVASGATTCGEIKPSTAFGPTLEINAGSNAPDVKIGRANPDGNICYIDSHKVYMGITVADPMKVGIKGPVQIGSDDPEELNLDVIGDVQIRERLITDVIDSLAQGHELAIGGPNCDLLRIGRFSSDILFADNGTGALSVFRGPVLINDGDEDHLANLEVQGNITSRADLGCTGDLGVGGEVNCVGNADFSQNVDVHGVLTVGTATQQATTNLNGALNVGTIANHANTVMQGDLFVQYKATVDGDFEVSSRIKIADIVACQVDLQCDANLNVDGKATIQSDTAVNGKLDVTGATSIASELSVGDKATFTGRTYHHNGVDVSPATSTNFSGMIKQNNRLEFFLDGTLRFYVDSTGGHNA